MERHDLSIEEPRHSKVPESEESVVQEESDDADDGCRVASVSDRESHCQEAAAHAKGADHETPAFADVSDDEVGDEGAKDVPEAVEAGEEE